MQDPKHHPDTQSIFEMSTSNSASKHGLNYTENTVTTFYLYQAKTCKKHGSDIYSVFSMLSSCYSPKHRDLLSVSSASPPLDRVQPLPTGTCITLPKDSGTSTVQIDRRLAATGINMFSLVRSKACDISSLSYLFVRLVTYTSLFCHRKQGYSSHG